MEYIKEYYNNNKKKFIMAVIILIALFSVFPVLITNFDDNKQKDNLNYELILLGDEEYEIYQDDWYIEPGYIAKLGDRVVSDEVKVSSFIDTTKVGTYEITYTIGNVKKTRKVKVIEKPETIDDINFSLIGDEKITIKVNEEYIEPGYIVTDRKNNDISDIVIIEGDINTKIPGTYQLTYSITKYGETKSLTREIIVIEDLKLTVDYNKEFTNQNITVSITVSGSNFSHIKLPNNKTVNSNKTTYTISENGVYHFYAFDTNNEYKENSITIDNIDKTKPTASCVAKSYGNKTVINVTARDNSKIDKYIYNNNYTSESSQYTIYEKLGSASVVVYDKAGNSSKTNCSISDSKIEMHFIPGISDDDAILIRTEDKTIMIDGGQWDAKEEIISYLKAIGVKKIDALIGSHVHYNHVQAHAAILDTFPVDKLYYSVDIMNCVSLGHCKSDDVKYVKDKIKELNKKPTILKPKDKLTIGEMEIYVIGPVAERLTTWQNANSLVFILKFGNNKFMFTGDTPDIYMDTTKFLQNASAFNMNIDVDVLKWPHHGYDDTVLKDEFFEATTLDYAIIPRYFCNTTWPTGTTKYQLQKYNIKHYEVCYHGQNVVLESNGKTITIKTNQAPENYKR